MNGYRGTVTAQAQCSNIKTPKCSMDEAGLSLRWSDCHDNRLE